MSVEDNVVKMPGRLEACALRIDAALVMRIDAMERSEEADRDWKQATLDLAVELAKARNEHRSNLLFGKWCDEHFGDNRLPHQDRAILVQWGADPEGTRIMLAKTDSRSVRMIDSRLTSAGKTPRSTTVKREEAEASIREHVARTGSYPTVLQAGQESGLSRIVIEPALATVKAEDRTAPSELRFTKAQDLHVEMRVKARLQELERTFEERVIAENQKQIKILFPDLKAIQDRAALTEKLYRSQLEKIAILTEAEYRDILLCTHEGNPSAETRKRAFIAFNAKKLQLTGKR